jgi:hypothetical protein
VRTLLIPVLLGVLVIGTGGVAHASPAHLSAEDSAATIDLGSLLSGSGNFVGGTATGSVNLDGWQLTSNLAAGEAPRFVKSAPVAPNILAGSAWSTVGTAASISGPVSAVAVNGNDLYVGGNFTNAGGNPAADYLMRWNGSGWFAVGAVGGNGALNATVQSMAFLSGQLFVAGNFTNAAGIAQADYVARWTGSQWLALGSSANGLDGALNDVARTILATPDDIYVGGTFTNVAGIATADYVARWTTAAWTAVDNGTSAMLLGTFVYALGYRSTASGFELYIGGNFTNVGGVATADRIARWNGTAWAGLGSNGSGDGAIGNGYVEAIAIHGSDVYVGGGFTNVAGMATADNVARFDGSWHALGSDGAGNGAIGYEVMSLLANGSDLYVGGGYINAAGIAQADYLAKWNGTGWFALGSSANGLEGALPSSSQVLDMAVLNDTLYVGGAFTNVAGISGASYVAAYGPLTAVSYQPDGRIKKGSTGTLAGNDIYNTSGTNQTRSASKAIGTSVTFYVSIQNDGAAADSFKVSGAGSTTMYSVRYYRGTTEITSAVVAGTYQTASLAVGSAVQIKAVVKVKSSATVGSSVSRLVTLTSTNDGTKKDAVLFSVKRS